MDILLPGLRASVTQAEYASGLGQEFQELYISTPEGEVYQRRLLNLGRQTVIKVPSIPGVKKGNLPEIKQDLSSYFPRGERIPYHMLDQIVAFFRKVMEGSPAAGKSLGSHTYEAMAHIVWSEERGYRVAIPTQQVSAAALRYEWDHIETDEEIILDIHSHNNMGAFFSGTDDGDDRSKIGFSGVAGKLSDPVPSFAWRYNDLTNKLPAKMEDIFTSKEVEVPAEWISQVTFGMYSRANNMGGGYNSGKQPALWPRGNRGGTANRNTGSLGKPAKSSSVDEFDELGWAEAWGVAMGEDTLSCYQEDFLDELAIRDMESREDEELHTALSFTEVFEQDDVAMEVTEAPDPVPAPVAELMSQTLGRVLGPLEPRLRLAMADDLPDDTLAVCMAFLAGQPANVAMKDLYFDMSEYFLFQLDEDTGEINVDLEEGEVGSICNRILLPEEAMKIIQTDGPYMAANYDEGFYLVGEELHDANEVQIALTGVSIVAPGKTILPAEEVKTFLANSSNK